jgi:hypothetical protein
MCHIYISQDPRRGGQVWVRRRLYRHRARADSAGHALVDVPAIHRSRCAPTGSRSRARAAPRHRVCPPAHPLLLLAQRRLSNLPPTPTLTMMLLSIELLWHRYFSGRPVGPFVITLRDQ